MRWADSRSRPIVTFDDASLPVANRTHVVALQRVDLDRHAVLLRVDHLTVAYIDTDVARIFDGTVENPSSRIATDH